MTRGRILVAGAINTDLVATVDRAPEAGETITGRGFAIYGGGKGANQAVAARRSGASVVMLGGVGKDDFGAARRADLTRDGIDDAWIATIPDVASGVALITVETSGENRIAYVPGATLKVGVDHCLEALTAVRPELILAANELPHACHVRLFERARESGVRVVFNAAPDPEIARDLLPLIDVLIVNRGEAAAMAGIEGESKQPEELVDALRAAGARDGVITLGADGACGWADGRSFHQPAPKVEAVDTTGAGDAFCGALAARLRAGDDLDRAVRYGVVAGALAAMKPGAQSSIPTRDEIERELATLE
ncbi:MAG TPA: ribokinase [Thermomicrobiales bacterium]|nr:ribokinase [Thermomicrobiales bacterium]